MENDEINPWKEKNARTSNRARSVSMRAAQSIVRPNCGTPSRTMSAAQTAAAIVLPKRIQSRRNPRLRLRTDTWPKAQSGDWRKAQHYPPQDLLRRNLGGGGTCSWYFSTRNSQKVAIFSISATSATKQEAICYSTHVVRCCRAMTVRGRNGITNRRRNGRLRRQRWKWTRRGHRTQEVAREVTQ